MFKERREGDGFLLNTDLGQQRERFFMAGTPAWIESTQGATAWSESQQNGLYWIMKFYTYENVINASLSK